MSIIGISGRIGSGKDTVGQIIQLLTMSKDEFEATNENIMADLEHNGYYASKSNWQIKKFADKLKDCVCIILGCTRKQLEDIDFKNKELGEEWLHQDLSGISSKRVASKDEYDKIKNINYTPRKIMQLLGTECGRQILHPDIWVNATMVNYKTEGNRHISPSLSYYPSKWIITDVRFPNEAKAIKNRNGIVIKIERGDKKENEHESETALDNYQEFDYLIDNNRSIEQLIERTREILIDLKII